MNDSDDEGDLDFHIPNVGRARCRGLSDSDDEDMHMPDMLEEHIGVPGYKPKKPKKKKPKKKKTGTKKTGTKKPDTDHKEPTATDEDKVTHQHSRAVRMIKKYHKYIKLYSLVNYSTIVASTEASNAERNALVEQWEKTWYSLEAECKTTLARHIADIKFYKKTRNSKPHHDLGVLMEDWRLLKNHVFKTGSQQKQDVLKACTAF